MRVPHLSNGSQLLVQRFALLDSAKSNAADHGTSGNPFKATLNKEKAINLKHRLQMSDFPLYFLCMVLNISSHSFSSLVMFASTISNTASASLHCALLLFNCSSIS